MKHIKSLLTEEKYNRPGVVRFKYEPYSIDIAKHVWFGFVKKYLNNKEFKFGVSQAEVWTELIKYIHGDIGCIYNLNKSICLMGQTGSGKTMTMNVINKYIEIDNVHYMREGRTIPFSFRSQTAREIAAQYQLSGYDGIAKYMVIGNLCIDDLGTEPETSLHFGNKIDVITEIIETRYNKGLLTHFTTNLNEDAILSRYNSRVHSRIIDTCNMIELNDCDFRIV